MRIVTTNRRAVQRDDAVAKALAKHDIAFRDYKDQVIFEKSEVLTQGGTPFSVFTPYKNAWLKRLLPGDLAVSQPELGALAAPDFDTEVPTLEALGFEPSNLAELKFPPRPQRCTNPV